MKATIAQAHELGVDGIGPLGLDQEIDVLRRAYDLVGCEGKAADEGEARLDPTERPDGFSDLAG